VIDDIEELLPCLSPNHPENARFMADARGRRVAPFRIHEHDRGRGSTPTTWPKTDPIMGR